MPMFPDPSTGSDTPCAQGSDVTGVPAADDATIPALPVAGDRFEWIGGASGDWSVASNWFDLSTNAAGQVAPGAVDSVLINGAGGTTITGAGSAHDLSASGDILFDGAFDTGALFETGATGTLSVSADGTLAVLGESATAASGGAPSALPTGAAPATHAGTLTVDAGASFTVPASPMAVPIWNDGTTELAAGSGIPTGSVLGSGTVLVDGGLESAVSYAATSQLGPSLGADQHIRFNGPDASLYIGDGGEDPTTPILVQAFAETDVLAVAGSVTGMQTVETADGELLELTMQASVFDKVGSTRTLLFDQHYAAQNLAFSSSFVGTGAFGRGYTVIELEPTTPCFCPGTLIATPDGERPVETLRNGDAVLTAGGDSRALLWIGRRSYSARAVSGCHDTLPIRIRAGALGNGLPRRDLLVSPRHAMLVRGVLVPAGLLLNNRSVSRETASADVHYLHLELENHELLLAEGAATESFVDDNSRAMFQNADEYAALYPDRPARPPRWFAPRVEDGEQLLAAQRYVDALAGVLPEQAPSPLHGHIDGREGSRLRGWALCPLRPDAPVLLDVMADGVAVARVLADRYRADLADAGIGAGCHGFEATLPDGARSVEVRSARDGARLAAAWTTAP